MFLVMHIRFVGVYSGNVNKEGFLVQTGGNFLLFGFLWYPSGDFLVQNIRYKLDVFLVGTTTFHF